MNLFKIFGAGLSSWGAFVIKHWWKFLLGIVLVPIAFLVFAGVVGVLAFGMFKFIMWTTTFPGWIKFTNEHPREIAFGMMGGMVLFVILQLLYQDGKKKLQKQNDKVSSI